MNEPTTGEAMRAACAAATVALARLGYTTTTYGSDSQGTRQTFSDGKHEIMVDITCVEKTLTKQEETARL